jgi:hypothetical protein
MSDVRELVDRITVALDRIRRGVEAQGRSNAAEQSLFDALQAERAQTAGLMQRVGTQQAQLQEMDVHLQRLRAATERLRDLNGQLRTALTAGLTPELIDTALAAEVEALQALRAADAAEVDAILAELKPLIEDAIHAAG